MNLFYITEYEDGKRNDNFDSAKMLACVTKLYETNIVTSQNSEDEAEDENEAVRKRGKENEWEQKKELNVFQKRQQKDNEHFLRTRVKRTYGWIERCEQTDKLDAVTSGNQGRKKDLISRRVDSPNTVDIDSEKFENSDLLLDTGTVKTGKPGILETEKSGIDETGKPRITEEQRQQWRDEAFRRRQRELINKVRGVTFTPSSEGRVTTKGMIYKRRHVNQLFVRGDNIVLVAYDKP